MLVVVDAISAQETSPEVKKILLHTNDLLLSVT